METAMKSILFISTLASGLALSAVAWAQSAPPQSYQSQIDGATNNGYGHGYYREPVGRYPMYEGRAAAEGGSYVYTPQGEFAPPGAPPVQYAPGGAGGYTTIP
jgi:hypothetical protein